MRNDMNEEKNIILNLMVMLLCCSLWVSCSRDVDDFYNDSGVNPDTTKTNEPVNPVNPVDDMAVYMLPEPQYIRLTAEQKAFAAGNNQFALNFLKAVNTVASSGQSFIYSPLSIVYVLGMVNDAAEGQTRQELEQTLGFGAGGVDAINEYCQTLIEKLPLVDPNVQLDMANAIFVSKRYALKQQFSQHMQQYYHALAESLDFSSPTTLGYINDWCNQQTRGMIPSILDKVNPDAVSYLLNAIYFKAGWSSKFDPKETKTEDFSTEGGNTIQVPLMHQNVLAKYMKNDTYSAIYFSYGSGLWNMTIMLPEEGKTTDDIIERLADAGHLEGLYGYTAEDVSEPYIVDLKVPRFTTMSDTDKLEGNLVAVLKGMGIRQAFDSYFAQIPNMCEDASLFINRMRQKAAIEVNEEGAKASAVTIAETLATEAGPTELFRVDFHANRPFVYFIREASSGVLLFVGKFTGM